MYISSVYLSTYNVTNPISGQFTIKGEDFAQDIKFTPDEAAQIQEICAKALERHKAAAAQALLSADIRVPALPAPEASIIEDADFEEVGF